MQNYPVIIMRSGLRMFRRSRKKTDPIAVEIARLVQGTPVVGYHDEDGHLVIP